MEYDVLNFCVICKSDIKPNDTDLFNDVTSICPFCNSLFHSSHLSKWLEKKSSCPNCRQAMHNSFTPAISRTLPKFNRICNIQFHLKLRRSKKSGCYYCGRTFDYPKIEFIQSNVLNNRLSNSSSPIPKDIPSSNLKNPLEIKKSGTQAVKIRIPIHRTFKTQIYKFDEPPIEKYTLSNLDESHSHTIRKTEVNVITILIMYIINLLLFGFQVPLEVFSALMILPFIVANSILYRSMNRNKSSYYSIFQIYFSFILIVFTTLFLMLVYAVMQALSHMN